ncbi:hypothetical protein VPH35_120137 [Triticum aestivum]
MDLRRHIYTLEMYGQLGMQEITTDCPPYWTDNCLDPSKTSWLVHNDIVPMIRTLHRHDMSTKPTKWVEMGKLDNWAIFTGSDMRGAEEQSSKCLYVARFSPRWSVYGLGNEPNPSVDHVHQHYMIWCHMMQPLWVYPSMFYSNSP